MTASVPVSPTITNNAVGSFGVTWDGLVQGTANPDPETRYALRGGFLSNNETIPMWGGVGIYVEVPGVTGGPIISQGAQVGRATSLASTYPLLGFSVFDQAYGMVNSPVSPVPLIGSYGQVMYYLLGSGARIAVACDPALVSLEGEMINTAVSWDFTNQLLIASLAGITITTGSTYNNTTGVITLILPSTGFSAGDSLTLSSLTGTGAYASLDGTWTVLTVTGTTGATLQGPIGVGASTITGGTATVGGIASGVLPVKVERVYTSNCMTVNWATPNATWNRNGSAAVILI